MGKQGEGIMAKRKTNKARTYVCVVCGKGKRASKKVKCCDKDMVAKKRGTWNA